LLDFSDTAQPIEDYLAALRLLEGVAGDVDVVIPGHGSIGAGDQLHARIDQDRAYVQALRETQTVNDARLAAHDWLSGVHERQLRNLARTREHDGSG
jgi:glyoxylase-like metal-dependent hydrolase (beta-lactamase superfamily II)